MKVLVATEGSEFSDAAVREFCRVFKAAPKLSVKVVSVVEPTFVPTEPFAVPPELMREIDNTAKKRATRIVDHAAETIRSDLASLDGLETEVVTGSPEQALIAEAEEWGADLIVTGSHGHGFWKCAWLGSVSDAIIHHAPCSVLVVRQDDSSIV